MGPLDILDERRKRKKKKKKKKIKTVFNIEFIKLLLLLGWLECARNGLTKYACATTHPLAILNRLRSNIERQKKESNG